MLVEIRLLAMLLSMFLVAYLYTRTRAPRPMELTVNLLILAAAVPVETYGHFTLKAHVNNTLFYNAFALYEFLVILFMLQHLVRRNVLVAAGLAGVSIMAWGRIHTGAWDHLYTESILMLAVITLVLLLAALWQLAQRIDRTVQEDPRFWLLIGMLPYFGALIPMMGVTNLLYTDTKVATVLWSTLPFMGVLRHLFAAYGTWRLQYAQRRPA